jgi:hypothetical protein
MDRAPVDDDTRTWDDRRVRLVRSSTAERP